MMAAEEAGCENAKSSSAFCLKKGNFTAHHTGIKFLTKGEKTTTISNKLE